MLKNKKIKIVKKFDETIKPIKEIRTFPSGCINGTRRLLNISMAQLGKKLSLSAQGVHALEKRELEGSITLKKLKKVANSLGMELKYAFVPLTSLEDTVEKNALRKAEEIVKRSHQSMTLEEQSVDEKALKEQIEEFKQKLKNNLEKSIWD